MDALVAHMSPIQMFVIFASQLWIFVIFPLIVLKKLNYLTDLVESQFEEEPKEPQA